MILGVIVGATASGKTALACRVAEALSAEIICADSRQVYSGFSIGTAQPTSEERRRVPHHLVDFLSPLERYDAARFLRDVRMLVDDNPSKSYIVVGGTGLYVQTLLEGISEIPTIEDCIRFELQDELQKRGAHHMHSRLAQVDPASAARLPSTDTQRIMRGLEVFHQTGRPWSSYLQDRQGGFGSLPVVWLDLPREILYARIDARVEEMVSKGWLQEVESLRTRVPSHAPAFCALGYPELLRVAAGEGSLAEAVQNVQKSTRNYAKRQLTWFRNKVPSVRISSNFEGSSEILKDFRFF